MAGAGCRPKVWSCLIQTCYRLHFVSASCWIHRGISFNSTGSMRHRVKMGKGSGLSLFLLLLFLHHTHCQMSCPYNCQCYSQVQVLCAFEQTSHLPRNMSSQVKSFILMSSNVAYLFPQTFADSPQLTKLIFLENGLRSVHARAFENLTELQELEISGNPWLEHLFPGTFSMQGNLTKLMLNFNKFQTVLPGTFDSPRKLETLQMKGNIISELPKFLFLNLSNLLVLDLSQNKLEGIDMETFSGLAKLEILKFNDNLISNLTSDIFSNISQLTELHMERNRISVLPDGVFSSLTQLKVLNLRDNLLTEFGDSVFGFNASSLTELNLKGNKLFHLTSLNNLTSLTDLNLSSNRFPNLWEDIFMNLTALENLDLSENHLSTLAAGIFRNLTNIKSIYLNWNYLSELHPKQFEDQQLLQRLYLSNNNLKTLPAGIFDHFFLQNIVRLHGNPWRCDCHLWYLHDWVQRSAHNIDMPDRLLCYSPGFLRRRTIASIAKGELVCQVSQDQMPDMGSCSLHTSGHSVTISCKVDKCSPLTVKVQFEQEDGSMKELALNNKAENTQCSNETVTDSWDE